MAPTYREGQLVALISSNRLQIGDVIMFEHDGLEKIKRIARVDDRRLYVLGDNPQASKDSRQFGWIGMESVRGKVIWPKVRSTTLAQ
jgi:phage repressor protein C with HTH and peptisase S24 domain